MSEPASPRRIAKKQSLSILSSSTLNQINNSQNHDQLKPAKDRIISESTGLIKFSIKKPTPSQDESEVFEDKENLQDVDLSVDNHADPTTSDKENDTAEHFSKMPIYIPINCEENTSSQDDTQELLFKMAAQQRKVLDLTEQLKQAKDELARLEEQCKDVTAAEVSNDSANVSELIPANVIPSPITALRKSASIMNINPPKINAQEQIFKTQKQVANTFNQITSNISNMNIPQMNIPQMNMPNINLSNNNFLQKSKTFFETNLNKNIQIGSGLINSIFEKDVEQDSGDEEVSVDDDTPNFEYSVDFDLDRLTKMNVNRKMKGTILEDLEESDEELDNRLSETLSIISDASENDYGGEVTNM